MRDETREAMWGDVRGLLAEAPSALLWRRIWAHLEACELASDPEQQLITYLQGALSRWPDHLRVVPAHMHDRIAAGSVLLPLCRALHISADDPESGWSLSSATDALESPGLRHITTLSLARFDLALPGAAAERLMRAVAALPALSDLTLAHLNLSDAHVETLCQHAAWRGVQLLAIRGEVFGEEGCRALARCEALRGLEVLSITGRPAGYNTPAQGIGVDGVTALTSSALLRPAAVTLRHVGTSSKRARDWTLDLSAPFWRRTHTLDVGDNARLVGLTFEPGGPLRWLIAPRTGLSEGVLRGLLSQGELAGLEVLDLSDRERVLGGAAGPEMPARVITAATSKLDTSDSWDHGPRGLHELGPGWWDWESVTNAEEATLPRGAQWIEPGDLPADPRPSLKGFATRLDAENDGPEALRGDRRLSTLDVILVEHLEDSDEHPLEPFLERWQDALSEVRAMVWGAQPQEWSLMITDLYCCDLGALLDAFPALEWLGMVINARHDLTHSGPLRHERLKTLVIPSACMPSAFVARLAEAELPALEGLELWGGDTYYWDDCASTEAYVPLLTGRRFPHLKRLGLRNHKHSDALAQLLCGAPLLDGLESLDLSMSLLTDVGLHALMRDPRVWRLKRLNVSRTHVTDEAALSALAASGVEVIARRLKGMSPGEELYVEVVE